MKLFRTFAALALVASTAASAGAQTTFIGSDAAFGTPDGQILWGSLGPSGTTVSNPFAINTTIGGLSAMVSQSQANASFYRLDQDNGWGGNFAGGANLLWTAGPNGPMSLQFSSQISAFGTQIQQNLFGAFVAYVSAYDASNTLLGSYSVNGTSNPNGDNSAIFLGISSTTGIDRIEVGLSSGELDFAINDVRLNEAVVATPEPASFVLMATGIGALGLIRRRRKTA